MAKDEKNSIDMGGVSINSTGAGSNVTAVNQGEMKTTVSINNGAPDIKPVFDQAGKILETEMPEFADTPDENELLTMFGTPAGMVRSMYEEVEQDIAEPIPPAEFESKKQTWFQRAKAIAPSLLAGGLVVGEAVVSTFVSKSPVVAGLLAAIEFAKSKIDRPKSPTDLP